MSKYDLSEMILNVLANNNEPMTANDIAVALVGEASTKDINSRIKGLLSEAKIIRHDGEEGEAHTFTPSIDQPQEELADGAPSFLITDSGVDAILSDELEAALAEIEKPAPELHQAETKLMVLDRLIRRHEGPVGSVLADIRTDLEQIAA